MTALVDQFLIDCDQGMKLSRGQANAISMSLAKEMELDAAALIDVMLALQGDPARARRLAAKLRCRVLEEPRTDGKFTVQAGVHRVESTSLAFAILAAVIHWRRSMTGKPTESGGL